MKKEFHIKDHVMLKDYKARLESRSLPIYVDGIGFLPYDKKRIVTQGVRRMTNLICITILLYFILQKMLLFPLTVFAYFVGANISINYYTGLIITTPLTQTLISSMSYIASLFAVTLLIYFTYIKSYKVSGIFKKPHKSVTSLAVFMVLSVYIFSWALAFFMKYIADTIGFIFTFPIHEIASITPTVMVEFFVSLVFVILCEFFLRGVILTPLRRFGDGFAVIACSLFAGIFSGGFLEIMPTFLVSVALCYFVIRSGSVWTAVACRICCEIIMFLFKICMGMLDPSLGIVILLLVTILAVLMAAFSFVTYIKADKNAFRLFAPADKIQTRCKLSTLACTVGFLLSCAYIFMRVVAAVQIIG